jgi:hypothetical protein
MIDHISKLTRQVEEACSGVKYLGFAPCENWLNVIRNFSIKLASIVDLHQVLKVAP